MTERAIFTWLREHEEQQAIQRAGPPRQPVQQEQATSIHYQEYLAQQQAIDRAQKGYRERLRAELLDSVPQATRDRLQSAQQALRTAQGQLQQSEEALETHSAEVPPVNASAAWVTKYATRKSQLQNEFSTYGDIADRAGRAYQDAQNAFDNQVAQLAQQKLWQAQQDLESLQRHWQSEIDQSFQKHQATMAQANRETQQAIDALERLRLSLS